MNNTEYFAALSEQFESAYDVAATARSKGYDIEPFVEIKPAPDLASRVEGIIGFEGLAELIKQKSVSGKNRQELAFDVAKEICTAERFEMPVDARIALAVRVGLAILTEGILVAPTEGISSVELHKNYDGSDYAALVFAGPIRSAGGTSVALSVALADYARRFLGVGSYRPQQTEIERFLEEIWLYDSRLHRLQYKPSDEDIRTILVNCPICIDSLPTEKLEISAHRNVKRLDANGAEQIITNKVRGALGLVLCEGIALKAKSVLKYTKAVGLEWGWLNSVIKVDKTAVSKEDNSDAFLHELVGGRPIFAYPRHAGGFRLRYGRSRYTGIAAKGFSPATMSLLGGFIAVGTQLKVEAPGKGCIAMPVDSIEGPFVKLTTGEAKRVNTVDEVDAVRGKIEKILSVGDILISYGDFKKTNTKMLPSSYVEEYWQAELEKKGGNTVPEVSSFSAAFELSKNYGVALHPKYIYDYAEITSAELKELAKAIEAATITKSSDSVFDIQEVEITGEHCDKVRDIVERLCVPHHDTKKSIIFSRDDAQSLVASLGFINSENKLTYTGVLQRYERSDGPLEIINSVAQFQVRKRATRLGARMGRPEKAGERLMKPSPNILFPVGEHGGKERSVTKAYAEAKRKFANQGLEFELARFVCKSGKEHVNSAYCKTHGSRAAIERVCIKCGRSCTERICPHCGSKANGSETRMIDMIALLDSAYAAMGVPQQKQIKGVKGLTSPDKVAEPLEKGILRAMQGIYTFKDGTSRFDATDAPITHFYPEEVSASLDKLRPLGYTKDFDGAPLTSEQQLLELMHQDVVLNRKCAEHMLKVSKFVDSLLVRFYKMEPFYNCESIDDMIGHLVITLSPHTSSGVLCRIVGFTDASVGLAHPYVICARRRNCDGDEDTTMLLLDGLINFSKSYLPASVGGTMDAPLLLTVHVLPKEVDDEVHDMEVVRSYGLEFYEKAAAGAMPSEVKLELVSSRLPTGKEFDNVGFTHGSSSSAVAASPKRSSYTRLKSMQEKLDAQCDLMDKLCSLDKRDAAKGLIVSHFIPDMVGNLHSFSKQGFRCVSCNAKYRRVPLVGKCTRCEGRILLTISKGSIEKYLEMAIQLADRYNVEPYTRQVLALVKSEIAMQFEEGAVLPARQFNLTRFM